MQMANLRRVPAGRVVRTGMPLPLVPARRRRYKRRLFTEDAEGLFVSCVCLIFGILAVVQAVKGVFW